MPPEPDAQTSRLFAAALSAAVLLAAGCDGAPFDRSEDDSELPLLDEASPLPAPRIETATMVGSGCPDPSTIYISGRRNTFFAELDDFIVTTSPQAPSGDADCAVTVTLSAPDGYAYAPAGMNLAITTDTSSRVTLATRGAWGAPPDPAAASEVPISTRGRRTTRKVLDDASLWSPCSGPRALHLTTHLRIRGEHGRPGYASIHELSDLQFRAQRCASSPSTTQVPSDPGPDLAGAPPRIDDVGLIGEGCSGSNAAQVVWSDDRQSFELHFRGFTAQGASQIQNCTASIELTAPPNHRASIESYVLEGRSQLPAGATATLDGSYWYPGDFSISPQENSQVFTYVGPREGRFVANAQFTSGDVTFGDCRRSRITFSLDAMVGSAAGSGLVEVERLHSLKFRLQACR